MVDFAGDVSGYPSVYVKRAWLTRKRFDLHISSRCMVFKPTERTKSFLEAWREECLDKHGLYRRTGCEKALLMALMRSTGVAFCPMDVRYSGRQGDDIPAGAVVTHASVTLGMYNLAQK
jgi:hypothetical protein